MKRLIAIIIFVLGVGLHEIAVADTWMNVSAGATIFSIERRYSLKDKLGYNNYSGNIKYSSGPHIDVALGYYTHSFIIGGEMGYQRNNIDGIRFEKGAPDFPKDRYIYSGIIDYFRIGALVGYQGLFGRFKPLICASIGYGSQDLFANDNWLIFENFYVSGKVGALAKITDHFSLGGSVRADYPISMLKSGEIDFLDSIKIDIMPISILLESVFEF